MHDRFGERKFWVLDRVDPEVVETGEGLNGRRETDEPFHEGDVRREVEDGIAREMVGLKFVEGKEAPEKV
jgi:hypothetical protein